MQMELLKTTETQSKKKKIVNVSSVPQRSPFRYPGGKTWFVPTFRRWIASQKRQPELLIEPFAGGGIISLTAAFENLTKRVLMVELDEAIAAVWKVLIYGDFEKLAKRIVNFELTLDNARAALDKKVRSADEMAFQTILRNRLSHGGIMAPGSGLIKNGEKGKGISSRWYPETLAKRMRAISEVRHKIDFVCEDAFSVIDEYSGDKDSVYFVDPPYTAGGKKAGKRLYLHHELDHELMFDKFSKVKGDFIFTYDKSEELEALSMRYKFRHKFIAMKNTHHAEMKEMVIGRDLKWMI